MNYGPLLMHIHESGINEFDNCRICEKRSLTRAISAGMHNIWM